MIGRVRRISATGGARVLVAAALFAAASASVAVSTVDDAGTRVELAQPAARIVSLAPHLTEQLFAIGAGDRIVGTTEFADYPVAAQRIPRVGRAHSVDLERIARLKPDLIVIWGSGFPPGTVDAVRRLGTPVFVSEPHALDDVATSMERLGVLTGRDGTPAATVFRGKIEALRARYARSARGAGLLPGVGRAADDTLGPARDQRGDSRCAAGVTCLPISHRSRRRSRSRRSSRPIRKR